MKRKPTEEEKTLILTMHRNRKSMNAMRLIVGCSKETLVQWFEMLSLQPTNTKKSLRTSDLAANEEAVFRSYYATMPTVDEMTSRYEVSKNTLNRWLEKLGLEKHPARARPQTTRQSHRSILANPTSKTYEEPIAQRFRSQGLVKLNPYR